MLRKIIKSIDRSFRFVEEWSLFTAVCVALLTAMANVILRKTTDNFSLYWSDEVVRKVIYFSTYIGCIAAVRSRSLIRIDALPQMLPVLKKPLTIISHLGVLVFAGSSQLSSCGGPAVSAHLVWLARAGPGALSCARGL